MTTKRERMLKYNSLHEFFWKVERNHKFFKEMK